MATKTQDVFSKMDYFLEYKLSDGTSYCDAYAEVLKGLSDIYSNQVANGLHTEEEIENFQETLPGTSAIFDSAGMHPDLSFIKGYFKENVKVHLATNLQESAMIR